MMSTGRVPWEAGYCEPGNDSFWGPPCTVYSELCKRLPRGGKVLDAGCGDGRHSVMFAQLGFTVIAVDSSRDAIARLKRFATDRGVTVTTVLQDISAFNIDSAEYDLVIAHGLLHLLRPDDAYKLVDRFKSGTRPGGYNVAVVLTDNVLVPARIRKYIKTSFADGELVRLYGDWDIVSSESYTTAPTDRIPYTRHLNRIVARRVQNAS